MIEKIKDILQIGIIKEDFPGASFCLVKDGNIKCDFIGYSQLYPVRKHLKENELYDVASLSKVLVTTILTFKLIELKQLNLKDYVSEILPNFKHQDIKIEDLLLHQSGLRPVIHNSDKVKTKEDLIKQIYDEPLIYEPRTEIRYSDTGFMLLGFIIEKIINITLDLAAKKYIFEPLNLVKTTYYPKKEETVPTEILADENYVQGYVHDERARLLNGISGHAGLFSTSYEIAVILKSILEDEKIISEENKKLIFEKTLIKEDGNGNELVRSYGFQKYGFLKNEYESVITHTGFTGCNLWIDRKKQVAFILITNAVHPRREYNKIFNYRVKILKLFYNF